GGGPPTAPGHRRASRPAERLGASKVFQRAPGAMKLLTVAGVLEVGTGLALLVAPSPVARLLLGAEPIGIATPVARVAGLALAALGVGCCRNSVWLAMWLYTALAALYLGYL